MFLTFRSVWLFLAGLIVATTGPILADEPSVGGPIPEQVLQDWQARRNACRSLHWIIKVRELLPPGILNPTPEHIEKYGPLPKEQMWRERELESWIDLQTLRVRHEDRGMVPYLNEPKNEIGIGREHIVFLFDGDTLQTQTLAVAGYKTPPGSTLSQAGADSNLYGLMLEAVVEPAFWGAGIAFGPENPYRVDKLTIPFRPQLFRIAAVTGPPTDRQLALRSPRQRDQALSSLEYAVDITRRSAIVRKTLLRESGVERQTEAEWEGEGLGSHAATWRIHS